MTLPAKSGDVLLANGHSASAILHAVLLDGVNAYSEDLSAAALTEDPRSFRKTYSEALPCFEAARLASKNAHAIARHLARAIGQQLVWKDADGERCLDEALSESVPALPLETRELNGQPGWTPTPVYRGERWEPHQLTELSAELVRRQIATAAAGAALAWVADNLLNSKMLRLTGRKIVVFGANAEMAPTRSWLEAGAEVLWLDIAPPPDNWFEDAKLAGRLHWPSANIDLLKQPREALATIVEFCAGDAADLCLYAYAPGQARELRLTGAMNAIVNALPAELISSVTMLVSPTTPTALGRTDREAARERLESRPLWESGLAGLGLLGRGGGSISASRSEATANAAATRTVVSIQGTSYQAAQYLGKVMMAECWSSHGAPSSEQATPLRVSANTAAITRTRSLNHPVFAAAFGGAAAFGVETFTPRQSRNINGLLALHDWHHPDRPVPGAVRVHGGIHTLPYPLEPALRIAAGFGFVRSPRLLRGLLRR